MYAHFLFGEAGSEPIQQKRKKILSQSTVNSLTKCVKGKPNLATLERCIF